MMFRILLLLLQTFKTGDAPEGYFYSSLEKSYQFSGGSSEGDGVVKIFQPDLN
jgi:hypothetical protein